MLNDRTMNVLYSVINLMIILDILLIINLLFFNHTHQNLVWAFDVIVCMILLFDLFLKIYYKEDRKNYFKRHFLEFLASIPLEFISPIFILMRFMLVARLFKLFRLSSSFSGFFDSVNHFFESTKLDRLITWIMFTVIIFTFALYFFDPDLNLFDSLWFVVVTLTTVGYGDVTPNNPLSRLISILLLILGIFIFSTLTGAISSFFTDKILDLNTDTEEALAILDDKVNNLNKELEEANEKLELVHLENKKLHEKIDELLKK